MFASIPVPCCLCTAFRALVMCCVVRQQKTMFSSTEYLFPGKKHELESSSLGFCYDSLKNIRSMESYGLRKPTKVGFERDVGCFNHLTSKPTLVQSGKGSRSCIFPRKSHINRTLWSVRTLPHVKASYIPEDLSYQL